MGARLPPLHLNILSCASGPLLGLGQCKGEKGGRSFGGARRLNAAAQTAGQLADDHKPSTAPDGFRYRPIVSCLQALTPLAILDVYRRIVRVVTRWSVARIQSAQASSSVLLQAADHPPKTRHVSPSGPVGISLWKSKAAGGTSRHR